MEVMVDQIPRHPLPVESVALEMRQREVCFEAQPGVRYGLRYGDESKVMPSVYDYARTFRASAEAVPVVLGAEVENDGFVARRDERGYRERHPELVWIGLIVLVAVLGGTAIHSVKGQGRHS